VHRRLGGDTARTANPNGPKGYPMPYGVVLTAYKAGGRRRKRGTSGVMVSVLPSNRYAWWSSAFLEMAEHGPASGKW